MSQDRPAGPPRAADLPRARDLAVIIPTRDRWGILARTLDALTRQSVEGFEVVVVVDGMDQSPPDLGSVKVVRKSWGGPGAARNAGVASTRRGMVLFLGDDMVPCPDLIERHLEVHAKHARECVAVLGGVRWHPEVANGAIERWLDWSGSQFDLPEAACDDAGFGRFVSCNVSLDRGLFESVGGFDEDFVYCYEDLDLGWRLAQAGMRLVYDPAAMASHLHRYGWESLERRYFQVGLGESLMEAKHPWFTPYFGARVEGALRSSPLGRGRWPAERAASEWLTAAKWIERFAGAAPEAPPADFPSEPRQTSSSMLLPGSIGAFALEQARKRADRACYRAVAPSFSAGRAARGELEDLREYLGDLFEPERLVLHDRYVEEELESLGAEDAFYRKSESYLYDLTAFAMSGTKDPYRAEIRALLPAGSHLLDYGCGIGSDGLALVADGYDVSFADFSNPSTEFLRWRLQRRGLDATVYDLDADALPGGFDAVYAFDVLEHVDDPFAFLRKLESLGSLVIVNALEPEAGETRLHRPLPVGAIVEHARSRTLLCHRVFHGRSHLLAYRPARVAGLVGPCSPGRAGRGARS